MKTKQVRRLNFNKLCLYYLEITNKTTTVYSILKSLVIRFFPIVIDNYLVLKHKIKKTKFFSIITLVLEFLTNSLSRLVRIKTKPMNLILGQKISNFTLVVIFT